MSLKHNSWAVRDTRVNQTESESHTNGNYVWLNGSVQENLGITEKLVAVATRSDSYLFQLIHETQRDTYYVVAGCRGRQSFDWWKQHCREYTQFSSPTRKRKWGKMYAAKQKQTRAILRLFELQIEQSKARGNAEF